VFGNERLSPAVRERRQKRSRSMEKVRPRLEGNRNEAEPLLSRPWRLNMPQGVCPLIRCPTRKNVVAVEGCAATVD